MSTVAASSLLADRFRQLTGNREGEPNNASSIVLTVSKANSNTSIELPQAIDDLIDNKMYRNKYKKLVREGHLGNLLELAAIAQTKDWPSHWFAKATKTKAAPGQEGKPTNWERALKFLTKLRQVALTAERVAKRIGAKVNNFIYKQIWKGVNVERWAVTAEEVSHNKPGQSREKHFAWLCINERRLTAEAAKY